MPSLRIATLFLIGIGAPGLMRAQDRAAGPDSDQPSTVGGNAKAPKMVSPQELNYDSGANAIEGKVILTLVVDKNGIPQNIVVKKGLFDSSGKDVGLNEKAVEAVRKWRFQPGTRHCGL